MHDSTAPEQAAAARRDPTEQAAIDWIVGSDTGTSSKAIWAHMMGATKTPGHCGWSYPSDSDDFGRCARLLRLVPAWRARTGEMSPRSPQWAALAAHWDELTELYETSTISQPGGRYLRHSVRMREILKGAGA
jgi:hypothetical protein